jgi:hypothetical protein
MADESPSVLDIARTALEQEFRRMAYLVNPDERTPLGKEYARRVNECFNQFLSDASDLLEEIKDAEDSIQAWENYARFRARLMPVFATELLAVIGGLYLIEKKLDNPLNAYWVRGGLPAGDEERTSVLDSFSRMAEDLVNGNLTYRTGRKWSSVLIVGEERVAYPEAEIIRLRFPACDIWNLPFTAAEYGYLLARNTKPDDRRDDARTFPYYDEEVELLSLPELRRQLEDEVDPQVHGEERPEAYLSFLPEIVGEKDGLWDRYYLNREIAPAAIERLKKRQDEHFCRLFADAFATAYIGPAYVHALLHLRFIPDESLEQFSPEAPPFALRFVFALETLRWMNDHYRLFGAESYFEEGPFGNDVDPSTGIRRRWLEALAAAGKDPNPLQPEYGNTLYDRLLDRHRELLRRVHAAMIKLWLRKRDVAYMYTYESWKATQDYLLAGITQTNPRLPKEDHITKGWGVQAVLNAAWAARVRCDPDTVETIEKNALLFLDPAERDRWYRPGMAREGGGEGPSGRLHPGDRRTPSLKPSIDEAKAAVVIALVDSRDALERFNAMNQRGVFSHEPSIVLALSANREALKMYQLLIDRATQ